MTIDLRSPEERRLAAGEYVLGTLTTEERREFERAATADPQLSREIHAWESRLAGLALRLPPASPRPIVWLSVLQAVSIAPAPMRPARGTRIWAALATAASLVLAFGWYREMNRPLPEPLVVTARIPVPAETYVALLQVPRSTMQWTMMAVPARNELAIRASGELAAAADQDAELWLIDDGRPVSLGVIPLAAGEVRRSLPGGIRFALGRTVAVSLEPKGGSPTGQPTGPVVTTAPVMQAG